VIELGPDLVTGKRRKKWHSGYRTLKEAKAARVELLSQFASMTYVYRADQGDARGLPRRVAVGDRADGQAEYALQPRPQHATAHPVDPGRHAAGAGRCDEAARVVRATAPSGRKNGKAGGLSPRSVSYVYTILHSALNDAVRWGRLIRNAADLADPPKRSATARR